ncbi:ABC transporter substrate-binding protein [Microbacterium sp. W4I20]|uniref:ABC transporter substrate-binding protein n=1 Tax=Microbacterium sp. W4I20 TaxID=3042262 RepID=UPI00277F306E|nr:ABC transporter substrate-binding protein [Microbacterium sp. W4I20]MDQ0727795.1 peptide/nickel transport system substrate-binding protein [Microbacterium sp. W4I20]
MKRSTALPVAAVLSALALTLASCAGSPDTSAPSEGDFVSGGTFVTAVGDDPGDLNPLKAVSPDTFAVVSLAYESLIAVTSEGELVPWLAESWEETGTEVVFTLKDDITCTDGSEFTAQTVADNLNYNADPANATFSYGSVIDEKISATADGNTVTVTSTDNNPFLAVNTGTIMLVCDSGLADPTTMSDATDGTGLFGLSDIKPGDTYTFTKRDDYTWGPDDVTSETEGLPDTIEARVVTDESTAANLLVSGEINAATISGADRARLDAAGLTFAGVRNPVGMILFNEKEGRPFSDPLVREALSTAIDRDEVGTVIADGEGLESISLVTKNPLLCVPDEPTWTLPDTDLDRAAELLDEAGWLLEDDGLRYKDGKPLNIKFVYNAPTSTHAAAAELVKETWDGLGVTTELSANDAAAWSEQLYSTADWDTGWVQIAPGGPVLLSVFFDGATPDQGGLNFMWVDNPEYSALVAEASSASPEEACGIWQDAEDELIERFDVFPVVDNILPTYQSGATFDLPNFIQPTSIRMLG